MVLEVLVHIQAVQVFGVKPGEQHIHNKSDIDLLVVGKIGVSVLLIFDTLLHILIIQVELTDAVVSAEEHVVVINDNLERRLFTFRVLLVVDFFLRQIFLQLLDVGGIFLAWAVAVLGQRLRWRREYAGDVQWHEGIVLFLFLGLEGLECFEVFDGVVDVGRG
ncbi:hypothetical protein ALQ55_200274 [Pseudomonas savastanoi pv. savastanoi]|nr:hypothetical protein ALQ55_200274 [Pseudomonas savastanoi pv. savastanoi]